MVKRIKIKTYKAAPGACYTDSQAEIIGRHLEVLGDGDYQDITPEAVVKDAKKKLSPLHQFFEWDDLEAAMGYRLSQARNLLNHLHVVIITAGGEVETKAFHNISVSTNGEILERIYRPVAAMGGPLQEEIRQQVLETARKELESWRQRYAEYKNVFGSVFVEIDRVLQAMDGQDLTITRPGMARRGEARLGVARQSKARDK